MMANVIIPIIIKFQFLVNINPKRIVYIKHSKIYFSTIYRYIKIILQI